MGGCYSCCGCCDDCFKNIITCKCFLPGIVGNVYKGICGDFPFTANMNQCDLHAGSVAKLLCVGFTPEQFEAYHTEGTAMMASCIADMNEVESSLLEEGGRSIDDTLSPSNVDLIDTHTKQDEEIELHVVSNNPLVDNHSSQGSNPHHTDEPNPHHVQMV